MRSRTFIIIVLLVAALGYLKRAVVIDAYRQWWLPPEVTHQDVIKPTSPIPTRSPSPTATPTPFAGMNLAVPFSPQAPFADWSLPYGEACEEVSAMLVDHFYREAALTPEIAKQEIDALVQWQQTTFGYYKHTTARETAQILKQYFGYRRVEVFYDVTIADIRAHILAGRPVIVPLAGRLLGNPNYRQPGPIYHMLVVKGIAKNGDIITNDVGTSRGHNYVYTPDVFLHAMHDVPNSGDDWPATVDPVSYILTGRRAMIVVYPN